MKKASKAGLKRQFIELRAEGRSFMDIVALLHVSKPTLIGWSKELSADIVNARSERVAELVECAAIAKAARIRAFERQLSRMLAEADKRKLASLRTPELFTMLTRFAAVLRDEYQDIPESWTMPGVESGVESGEEFDLAAAEGKLRRYLGLIESMKNNGRKAADAAPMTAQGKGLDKVN